jgi:hypothetical protein
MQSRASPTRDFHIPVVLRFRGSSFGQRPPIVSQQAAKGYDEKLRPVLARKPLEQAENNYAEALDL